jgi:hypothetical protein
MTTIQRTDLHTRDLRAALNSVRRYIWCEPRATHEDAAASLRILSRYVALRRQQLAADRAAQKGGARCDATV